MLWNVSSLFLMVSSLSSTRPLVAARPRSRLVMVSSATSKHSTNWAGATCGGNGNIKTAQTGQGPPATSKQHKLDRGHQQHQNSTNWTGATSNIKTQHKHLVATWGGNGNIKTQHKLDRGHLRRERQSQNSTGNIKTQHKLDRGHLSRERQSQNSTNWAGATWGGNGNIKTAQTGQGPPATSKHSTNWTGATSNIKTQHKHLVATWGGTGNIKTQHKLGMGHLGRDRQWLLGK